MSKNLIPIIMKELGLEYSDNFTIKGISDRQFAFDNKSLLWRKYGQECFECAGDNLLVELIIGEYEIDKIIKPPFEPQTGDVYYTYATTPRGRDWEVYKSIWKGIAIDCIFKAAGCVFRTEEEAIKARPMKYKELTGKEWYGD